MQEEKEEGSDLVNKNNPSSDKTPSEYYHSYR